MTFYVFLPCFARYLELWGLFDPVDETSNLLVKSRTVDGLNCTLRMLRDCETVYLVARLMRGASSRMYTCSYCYFEHFDTDVVLTGSRITNLAYDCSISHQFDLCWTIHHSESTFDSRRHRQTTPVSCDTIRIRYHDA